MKLSPPNARFWTWLNDGLVKLTLKPDQTLNWCLRGRHDEGWSVEYHQWEWDGQVLTEQYGTDGTDCDGRHSTHGESFAELDQLRSVPAYDWYDFDFPLPLIKLPVDGVFYPAWTRGKQSQRDYAAEAMGY
jgi:hypothetical protein